MNKLSSFATVEPGYHLDRNHTLAETADAYHVYYSPRCETGSDIYYSSAPIPEKYFTKAGDIIVHTAKLKDVVLIEEKQEGLLVSDRYLIIRCNPRIALPGFICDEMLSDTGCAKRKKICRDAVLPKQKAKKYADLKFKLPSLEMQESMYTVQCQLDEFTAELDRRIKELEDELERKQYESIRITWT